MLLLVFSCAALLTFLTYFAVENASFLFNCWMLCTSHWLTKQCLTGVEKWINFCSGKKCCSVSEKFLSIPKLRVHKAAREKLQKRRRVNWWRLQRDSAIEIPCCYLLVNFLLFPVYSTNWSCEDWVHCKLIIKVFFSINRVQLIHKIEFNYATERKTCWKLLTSTSHVKIWSIYRMNMDLSFNIMYEPTSIVGMMWE